MKLQSDKLIPLEQLANRLGTLLRLSSSLFGAYWGRKGRHNPNGLNSFINDVYSDVCGNFPDRTSWV